MGKKRDSGKEPLRSEIFGPEQMQEYGKTLAESHQAEKGRAGADTLLDRLERNEEVLNAVRRTLTEALLAGRRIVPAAEWLLDNFYMIEDHIRTSKHDLPKGYSRQLPRLKNRGSSGVPRVYDIALQRISHCDGLVDPDTLPGFLQTYQSVSELNLGELWAIPIMLRLALIENLRRIAVRISEVMKTHGTADSWADRMILASESDPKTLILLVADMARSEPLPDCSFVAEFSRRLQGRTGALSLPLAWIEHLLAESSLSVELLVQAEMQQQAAEQVSISNTIRSLRSLSAKNWKEFIESTSTVEQILRRDPSGIYGEMDFSTRDTYRHVVEETARRSRLSEEAVAGCAVSLCCRQINDTARDGSTSHVGYYLIGKGFADFRKAAGVRLSIPELFKKHSTDLSAALYLGTVILSTSAATAALSPWISARDFGLWLSLPLYALAFACLSGLSVNLLNWLLTAASTPSILPRMDFSRGIPEKFRTLVIVPSMLSSFLHIDTLAENLEVRFLANQDPNLFFGLLTDFPDAASAVMPRDDDLLSYAQKKIDELNIRHSTERYSPMFLLHRRRQWNATEQAWIGYERKRGKLADLNDLLRGGTSDKFDLIAGKTEQLQTVKYVITLDTDTQLPRDSARRLAETMAHPLNRARYDIREGRITDGYGILQPRVSANLTGANRSRYSRMNAGQSGIDPYTRAVSDVYQDMFGEGSFIGKGIYDVDAFTQALKGRLPENRILSHDLLEGCYARSGLVSDVELFEETPSTYRADVDRRTRWMRGDWQILHWLLPTVPVMGGDMQKNTLSLLSRWKILDNIRRSLTPPALTALLLLGWTVLPEPLLWTATVAGIILIPPLFACLSGFFRKPDNMKLGPYFFSAIRDSALQVSPALFTLICLPYEAYVSLSTIARSVWRILISHRHLLEWRASEQHRREDFADLASSAREMLIAPVTALLFFFLLLRSAPATLLIALPILGLWFVSPLLVWFISRNLTDKKDTISERQTTLLRHLARKTWAFFETFVTAEENWLPPDNIQEIPSVKIAHRTSPTNIGLSLLANLAACDFGYISTGTMIERTDGTLRTMAKLEKHRNHLYNWYETITLQPLLPLYVSTVDSGNLAAHLLTLGAGLSEIPGRDISGKEMWNGLHDTYALLSAHFGKTAPAGLMEFGETLNTAMTAGMMTLADVRNTLVRLESRAGEIVLSIPDRTEPRADWWAEALDRQCRDLIGDLEYLMPWLAAAEFHGGEIPAMYSNLTLLELVSLEKGLLDAGEFRTPEFRTLLGEGLANAGARLTLIETLVHTTTKFSEMDFTFLFNNKRHLFSIGYVTDTLRQDTGCYDLLASEARIASFVAIAQGQISQENWFALGRLLTDSGGDPILLSWSGSMFEYLMPLLVMPAFDKTLLDQTCKGAVDCHIEYGKKMGVPWGISESGFNTFDVSLNYQYRAFGVPALGFKRGLVEDLVVAPYASALALLVRPAKACQNLQRLCDGGFEGDYGLYEAIDYTKSRVLSGYSNSIVRSFMAHHLGMSFLSFSSRILGPKMQARFASIPSVQATILLLEEKSPRTGIIHYKTADLAEWRAGDGTVNTSLRVIKSCDTPVPEVQLLSNGKYHVMLTNAGGGRSRWKNLSLTRWREDITSDNWGTFLYIRDTRSGKFWSNTFQPTLKKTEFHEAVFSEGRAEFRRRDDDFDTYTEIVVSPEEDIELRRIRITNRTRSRRIIDVTSFAEVVLAPYASDEAHPCFSNLFMVTEIVGDRQAILFSRRKRSPDDEQPWMVHLMTVRDSRVLEVSYETDRLKFIGRGNTVVFPDAMKNAGELSCSQGSVLDPIASIRQKILVESEGSVTIDMATGIGATREEALLLAEKYRGKRFVNRAFELARTHSQIIIQQVNWTEADVHLYNRLAGSILYAHANMRSDVSNVLSNRRNQSGLWGYSISGDLPIVLVLIKDPAGISLVRQLVQAHVYWHQKGLEVDLVIWNEEHGSYRQNLQEQILSLVTASSEVNVAEKPGGIFVRMADQIANEDRILFHAASRVILSDKNGTLEQQIGKSKAMDKSVPLLRITGKRALSAAPADSRQKDGLLFKNGLGGFAPDGREYEITMGANSKTPMPWANVIANPAFGTVISESGMAYTWSENAHEFRLTPWYNDPVSDSGGEAIYLRDEESGQFWSPTPLPTQSAEPYTTRHGFGYSVFEHRECGIYTELCVYVARENPVKFMCLTIRNESGRSRKLSATSYSELVLGDQRSKNAMHVTTEIHPESGAIFARNRYSAGFSERTVFLDARGEGKSVTGDRTEFLGRNGTMAKPDCMRRAGLSGRTGAALDPCIAVQIPFSLSVGQKHEAVFAFGAGKNSDEAASLVGLYRVPGSPQKELESVKKYWEGVTSAIRVETPDASLDILANGWLVYQIISSRLWGRSGYYQSGGAYGFRDQLQDAMALIHIDPALARSHIVLCASRQFDEGDVQHWWHPPHGQGSRTHCSDDYLWLPLSVSRYILITGDTGILSEPVSFIEGRPLKEDEESCYDMPVPSGKTASLYEHCARAVRHSLARGGHGLPLMGSGDWNDGMNMVGSGGKGESVWLGFFLYSVLVQFSGTAKLQGDAAFSESCMADARKLKKNIDDCAWDGQWFLRAWFDDGTPLGASENAECRIDSISQSWSVLSDAAGPERGRRAMESLDKFLVRREEALIKLLDPPFDKEERNPGYIKGYVPGVRENGGQYTHAAIWAAMAFARLGDSEKAWELFTIINPVNHSDSPSKIETYKADPYVMAADVYSVPPHSGRAGWTWYTGSAGWMYRLILESLLGFTVKNGILGFMPCIPENWKGFKLSYRYRSTVYHITVISKSSDGLKTEKTTELTLDGILQARPAIALSDDGGEHTAEFRINRGETG